MERKYDVIIVGAGIAGSSAALFLSQKGLKVAVLDVKTWNKIGDKPCGDAMSKHHFDELGIPYPQGEELEGFVKGILIFSPSGKTVFEIYGEGFEINRVKYTQKLLGLALDNGAEFFERTHAIRPLIRNNSVIGVIAQNLRTNKVSELRCNVVIDASGNARAIVRKLPQQWPVNEILEPKDSNIAYREVYKIEGTIDKPEFIRIYVNQKIAPGGYWWFFPKSIINHVNVGLGVQGGVGNPNPKELFNKYLRNLPELRNAKVIEKGGAVVPTRRPVTSLVWNGITVIGDAAYTVNPVHGGGKGSSVLAAKCVAQAILNAYNLGSFKAENLWSANICYIEKYGAKQASLDLFRMFLQKLSNDEIEYGMSHKVIKEEDLLETSLAGEIKHGIIDKALRVIASLGKPTLLFKLKIIAEYMKKIKKLYKEYPRNPNEVFLWKDRVSSLYIKFVNELSK